MTPIDRGRNISGANIGVVGQIKRACESSGASVPIFLHCIIWTAFWDQLCTSLILFYHMHSIIFKRLFQSFLEQIESVDLSCYTEMRWLSCGKVLLQFFKLWNEIDLFLVGKTLLSDIKWLWKLFFFLQINNLNLKLQVTQVNKLNLKLQGKDTLICDLFTQIKAFRAKLIFFEN